MSLPNQNWISKDGEPITGRVPAQVRVMNGIPLSTQQLGGVLGHFRTFCNAVHVTTAQFTVWDRKLPDGTRIRMVSNCGVDVVQVWPVGGTDMQSTFFALPGYVGSVGYPPYAPKFSAGWSFRGKKKAPTAMRPMRMLSDAPGTQQHPGNLTWWSEHVTVKARPVVVSWHGRATRYGRLDYCGRQRQYCLGAGGYSLAYGPHGNPETRLNWRLAYKPAVWTNGVKHAVFRLEGETKIPVPVMSAGIKKEGGKLFLWAVSFEEPGRLAVYRGAISLHSANDVQVVKQFDIDFTIDATSYAALHAGDSVQDAQWEALLQPIYFNASCTEAAGLVSAFSHSTVNLAAAATITQAAGQQANHAHYARMIRVGMAEQTTTFSGELSSLRFKYDISDGPSGKRDVTEERTSYGAVDYAGDALRIALVRYTLETFRTDTDAVDSPDGGYTGSQSRSSAQSVRTRYRVFLAHNDATLAEKDTGIVDVGSISTTSSRWTVVVPGNPGFSDTSYTDGVGSGSRSEVISAALYRAATIEGGDLRHAAVVVGEFLEVGDSAYESAIWPGDSAYATPDANGNLNTGGSGWGPSGQFGMEGVTAFILTSSTGVDQLRRKPTARLSMWVNGIELETTDYWENTGGGRTSMFGLMDQTLGLFPSGGDFGSWAFNVGYQSDTTRTGTDPLPRIDFYALWGTSSEKRESDPVYSAGQPYVNTTAFSPDGKYVFYNLGGFFADGSYLPGQRADDAMPLMAPVAAFIIDGVRLPMDMTAIVPTGNDPAFSSPVFIDNIPTRKAP